MGSQRVGHDWVTELNWVYIYVCVGIYSHTYNHINRYLYTYMIQTYQRKEEMVHNYYSHHFCNWSCYPFSYLYFLPSIILSTFALPSENPTTDHSSWSDGIIQTLILLLVALSSLSCSVPLILITGHGITKWCPNICLWSRHSLLFLQCVIAIPFLLEKVKHPGQYGSPLLCLLVL